jgi:GH24 family phage-related lysozyme (muramidase)
MTDRSDSYQQARAYRQRGLVENVTRSLASGGGVGRGISQTFKGYTTGIKEKFDPLNIAKMFGGRIGAGLVGKMTGRSQKDILYHTGLSQRRGKVGNVDAGFYSNIAESGVVKLRKGDAAADVATKIYSVMKNDIEEKKLRSELAKDREKEKRDIEKRRHKEFLKELERIKKSGEKVEKPEPKKQSVKEKKQEKEIKEAAKEAKPANKAAETKPAAPKAESKPVETKPAAPKAESKPVEAPKQTATKQTTVTTNMPTAAKVAAVAVGVAGATSVIAKIKKNEDYAEKAYHDPKKDKDGKILEDRYSVGYGHQITPKEVSQGYIEVGNKKIPVLGALGKDTTISKEDANILVEQDFKPYESAAKKIPNFDKLNSDAQAALIDMTYNMGVGWYYDNKGNPKWPSLHRALLNLDMESAAKSIMDSKYYKDTGKRAKENVELIRNGINSKQKDIPVENVTGQKMDSISKQNAEFKKQSGSTVIIDKSTNVVVPATSSQPIAITSTSDMKPVY